MDFDLSKENIQPLRGGRNVQQLGMALQAQTNPEFQLELKQQQEEFENIIRTYSGDDPLDNYYSYISWVEQSYPKHGHEGNLVSLLEHCLHLFEYDKRYTNDRRFCKLWIKYFDLQQNPLELYHMMKARGLCIGCADFYKAWAYYYEAAGNFQAANNVFEEGKRNLAQPYEDLEIAHKNLILAAGQHTIFGPDENRLFEKRQVLTALHTYKSGRSVPSIRIPSGNGLVTVPMMGNADSEARSNAMVFVYEDKGMEIGGAGAEAAPVSLVSAARMQEAPKENQLKSGPWTTMPIGKKKSTASKMGPSFTVLEDIDVRAGIKLSRNHAQECLEDYSDWRVSIKYPEPPNAAMIPMYPKERVYIDPNTEYSIDELRARRYSQRAAAARRLPTVEQEILEGVEYMQESLDELKNDIFQRSMCNQMQEKELFPRNVHPDLQYIQQNNEGYNIPIYQDSLQNCNPSQSTSQQQCLQRSFVKEQEKLEVLPLPNPDSSWDSGMGPSNQFDLWQSPVVIKHPPVNFDVFEQTLPDVQSRFQPKGSAMKTTFKDMNADELAETGSRGGMDIAATAQPTDCASQDRQLDLDDSCNTHMFNFNLNAMQVSTPQNKRSVPSSNLNEEEVGNSRKQLFTEPGPSEEEKEPGPSEEKVLSTIIEETNNGSSSSSGATTKSTIFNNDTNKMSVISEEHQSNLQQNSSVNAKLRSKLLGNYMDIGSPPPVPKDTSLVPPSPMQSSPFDSPIRQIPKVVTVTPLDITPSDPFKPSLINQLLERVSFPGAHTDGYKEIPSIPRLYVKKEPVFIGNEKYIIDKQLGKGTFGVVFKAFNVTLNTTAAVKYQKPPNKWEFYICRELQARLANHPLRERFMDVSVGYFSEQASILISEFVPTGSLLDLANFHKQKTGKPMKESLVMFFCIEMLRMVQAMHEVKIIHADIKPDNFLVHILPDNMLGLELIDFGCSIDMSLFPPNSAFTRRVTTEDFVCCEMLDGRPWNYHTDLFCIAATAHVLMFDTYIKLRKHDDVWSIVQQFKRYIKVDLWNMFFSSLLNQQTGPADTATLQFMLEEKLEILNRDSSTALRDQMRYIVNLLKKR